MWTLFLKQMSFGKRIKANLKILYFSIKGGWWKDETNWDLKLPKIWDAYCKDDQKKKKKNLTLVKEKLKKEYCALQSCLLWEKNNPGHKLENLSPPFLACPQRSSLLEDAKELKLKVTGKQRMEEIPTPPQDGVSLF